MKEYYSVAKQARSVLTVKKSKFICTVFPCESEADAQAKIKAIDKEWKDATHTVYAYLAGNAEKCSDDKEPQGTAGLPVMNVLKKKKLYNVCAVVTRYFGGIKLGASGLTGAYAASVAQTLEIAEICRYSLCGIWQWEIAYDMLGAVKNALSNEDIVSLEYGEKAVVTAKLKIDANAENLFPFAKGIKIKESYETIKGESAK